MYHRLHVLVDIIYHIISYHIISFHIVDGDRYDDIFDTVLRKKRSVGRISSCVITGRWISRSIDEIQSQSCQLINSGYTNNQTKPNQTKPNLIKSNTPSSSSQKTQVDAVCLYGNYIYLFIYLSILSTPNSLLLTTCMIIYLLI